MLVTQQFDVFLFEWIMQKDVFVSPGAAVAKIFFIWNSRDVEETKCGEWKFRIWKCKFEIPGSSKCA